MKTTRDDDVEPDRQQHVRVSRLYRVSGYSDAAEEQTIFTLFCDTFVSVRCPVPSSAGIYSQGYVTLFNSDYNDLLLLLVY